MIKKVQNGESCWNIEAIDKYVESIDQREAELAPLEIMDVIVLPGVIGCRGCVQMDDGRSWCSAELTQTRITLAGQEVVQQPELQITSDMIPGFSLFAGAQQ